VTVKAFIDDAFRLQTYYINNHLVESVSAYCQYTGLRQGQLCLEHQRRHYLLYNMKQKMSKMH